MSKNYLKYWDNTSVHKIIEQNKSDEKILSVEQPQIQIEEPLPQVVAEEPKAAEVKVEKKKKNKRRK